MIHLDVMEFTKWKKVNYHHDMGTSDYCISNEERKVLPSVSAICIVLVPHTYVCISRALMVWLGNANNSTSWKCWKIEIPQIGFSLLFLLKKKFLLLGQQLMVHGVSKYCIQLTAHKCILLEYVECGRSAERGQKKIIPAHKVFKNEIEFAASLGKKSFISTINEISIC